VDLFLLQHGHELPEKERHAFNTINGAVFGFFEVEESTPGTGLRAQLCGSSTHFDVVDADASRRLRPGEGFTAWLLPYQGHHEIAGKLLSYSRPFMVILHRLTQWDDSLRQQFSNSVEVSRIEETVRTEGAPTLKKREAKLFAKKVFGEVRFPLSVEDLELGLRSPEDLEEMLSRAKFTGLKTKESASRFLRAILLLGLHSSREAPGNLTTGSAPLPPPGIRAWPAEELRRKIAEAFSAGKKPSLSWLLCELASRGERLPADALELLLDDPSNNTVVHFLISVEAPRFRKLRSK
jgi:hypothetical protein